MKEETFNKIREEQKIIDYLEKAGAESGRRTVEVFRDFVEIYTYSLANLCAPHDAVWEERERKYTELIEKYSRQAVDYMASAGGELIAAFSQKSNDYLGEIYMSLSRKGNGLNQYFTPMNVAEMMAKICGSNDDSVMDPTCGSGVMLIADRNRRVENNEPLENVTYFGCDLDPVCAYMCFIQLSILGVAGVVQIGNTLTMEMRETFLTPMFQQQQS